jgi:hypothetical protein
MRSAQRRGDQEDSPLRGAPTCRLLPTSRPATWWRKACPFSLRPKRRVSCSACGCRSSCQAAPIHWSATSRLAPWLSWSPRRKSAARGNSLKESSMGDDTLRPFLRDKKHPSSAWRTTNRWPSSARIVRLVQQTRVVSSVNTRGRHCTLKSVFSPSNYLIDSHCPKSRNLPPTAQVGLARPSFAGVEMAAIFGR